MATVVYSRSYIADGDITIVLERGVGVPGVQLHQIIPKAGGGDTARVQEVLTEVIFTNVNEFFYQIICHYW